MQTKTKPAPRAPNVKLANGDPAALPAKLAALLIERKLATPIEAKMPRPPAGGDSAGAGGAP